MGMPRVPHLVVTDAHVRAACPCCRHTLLQLATTLLVASVVVLTIVVGVVVVVLILFKLHRKQVVSKVA